MSVQRHVKACYDMCAWAVLPLERPLPDPKGDEKGQEGEAEGRGEGAQGGDAVAVADLAGEARGQGADVVNVLAHLLLDAAGLVAVGQTGGKLGAEDVLEDGGADGDADAGAEGAEEVGAGDDDGHVLGGGVGKKADEGGGEACCLRLSPGRLEHDCIRGTRGTRGFGIWGGGHRPEPLPTAVNMSETTWPGVWLK